MLTSLHHRRIVIAPLLALLFAFGGLAGGAGAQESPAFEAVAMETGPETGPEQGHGAHEGHEHAGHAGHTAHATHEHAGHSGHATCTGHEHAGHEAVAPERVDDADHTVHADHTGHDPGGHHAEHGCDDCVCPGAAGCSGTAVPPAGRTMGPTRRAAAAGPPAIPDAPRSPSHHGIFRPPRS
ncbi:MAG: hypothetical protein EA351_01685 [Gemmatimonadales bacterium]|nr:MAG: hypothetical protein EA351_01685 [Gemmatimonadales bacterium]